MQLEIKENDNGFLIPLYLTKLNNKIKRVFFIKNKNEFDVRGNHAHFKDSQMLIVLNGEVEISYENSEQSGIVNLGFGQVYESRPLEWLVITLKEKDTILAVFSETEYDEKEYIRDYDQFKMIYKG